jgi:uncharacterized membrane protein YphA (DoxX/SURF4 family)
MNERIGMKASFNVAENGGGSYRLLAILRWVMVVVFVSFGMQKFTLQSAQGIVQFISNSPFTSWLSLFGLRGEAYFLGVVEFAIAALLAAGAFSPILSAVGSLMGWSLLRSRGHSSSRRRGSSNGACRLTQSPGI